MLHRLRRAVTALFLAHLGQQADAQGDRVWWEEHPPELQAVFREQLQQARAAGKLRTAGKLVLSHRANE